MKQSWKDISLVIEHNIMGVALGSNINDITVSYGSMQCNIRFLEASFFVCIYQWMSSLKAPLTTLLKMITINKYAHILKVDILIKNSNIIH